MLSPSFIWFLHFLSTAARFFWGLVLRGSFHWRTWVLQSHVACFHHTSSHLLIQTCYFKAPFSITGHWRKTSQMLKALSHWIIADENPWFGEWFRFQDFLLVLDGIETPLVKESISEEPLPPLPAPKDSREAGKVTSCHIRFFHHLFSVPSHKMSQVLQVLQSARKVISPASALQEPRTSTDHCIA